MITQHVFSKRVEFSGGMPHILFKQEVLDDIHILTDEAAEEISVLGTVRKVGRNYLVNKVYLPPQTNSATSSKISTDDLAGFSDDIVRDYPLQAVDILNAIRFHGHSHVNMNPTPSAADVEQLSLFVESCQDYFIDAIFNKGGRMEITLYLYDIGLKIHDCELGHISI
jgi:hypothetical protein